MKKQDYQQARAPYIKDATQVLVDGLSDATAVGYVKQTGNARRSAEFIIFYGKQSRPVKYYTTRTLDEAVREATAELERMLRVQARREQEAATKKAAGRAAYTVDQKNGITRRNYTPAGTAELIRQHLKQAFPGQKFSVTSEIYSMGSSVRVHYTDGPSAKEVEAIADQYKAGEFNGMDDSYTYAADEMKVDAGGAFYASYGAKFVTVHRSFSPGFGLWLSALDLRQPVSLADQVAAFLDWHQAHNLYNNGEVWHHPTTGNYLLSTTGTPEDFRRFASALEQQGARTELDFEGHQYYLGIFQPVSHCQAA